MAKYSVIVTRDTTESTTIEVVAPDASTATTNAMSLARVLPEDYVWEQDDTPNASKNPYITHCEEI